MKPRAVILAAGASRRLGRPKALAPLPAGTPLERLVAAVRGALPGEPPLLVTGRHHEELARAAEPLGVELLHHAAWSAGRAGSVAAAARALAGRDLLLAFVDQPRVPAEVLAAMDARWTAAWRPPRGWLAPWVSVDGRARHGHPLLVGRELLAGLVAEVAADPTVADRPLRDLRALAEPLLGVEVASASILEDLDTPADLSRLAALDAAERRER